MATYCGGEAKQNAPNMCFAGYVMVIVVSIRYRLVPRGSFSRIEQAGKTHNL